MSFISWKEKRFGRASLWAALFIHAFAVCLLVWGDHWLAYVFAVVLPAVLWIASYIDWRALLKIDHKHPNNHYPDVCEGCDPIQMWDGGPVTNIVWLYAASKGITRGEANAHIERLRIAGGFLLLRHEFDAYLKHDKFRNYPRP